MSKPVKEVKDKSYYKDIHFLYEILNTLKNVDEVKLFVKDILTKSELRMLKRRWHIANLLAQGLDMRSIAQKSESSTQTVANIKRILEEGKGGLKLALERALEKEEKERKQYFRANRKGGSKLVKNWFK